MRTQPKKIEKPNGVTAAPVMHPEPAAPVTGPKIPPITLRVHARDLWFVAKTLVTTPWAGGEQRVMALRNIHRVLRLDKINLDIMPNRQPTTPVEVVQLAHSEVELIIRTMCGEGMGDQAFGGMAGPMMSDVVAKLREAVVDTIQHATAEFAKAQAKA